MLLLSLLFLQLLNMHILQKPVFSFIIYCSTAMLSHTDSTILTVQLCQTFLAMFLIWGVQISLACLIQIWWWGKDWCFLKIFLSFLIDYTCFHARLSHHFITYIKGDLILVLFTFPSLSGLDRLFPCQYVFFIFFFSNRKKALFPNPHFSCTSQLLFLPRVYLQKDPIIFFQQLSTVSCVCSSQNCI